MANNKDKAKRPTALAGDDTRRTGRWVALAEANTLEYQGRAWGQCRRAACRFVVRVGATQFAFVAVVVLVVVLVVVAPVAVATLAVGARWCRLACLRQPSRV